jgi:hypothetical protein
MMEGRRKMNKGFEVNPPSSEVEAEAHAYALSLGWESEDYRSRRGYARDAYLVGHAAGVKRGRQERDADWCRTFNGHVYVPNSEWADKCERIRDLETQVLALTEEHERWMRQCDDMKTSRIADTLKMVDDLVQK